VKTETLKGIYTLHIQHWCDGRSWITKQGKAIDTDELFQELTDKDKQIAELKKERDQILKSALDSESKYCDLKDSTAEQRKILNLIHKDLLMRAKPTKDGCKVVDISSSIWIKLSESLAMQSG
jgi:hypothetical protein